ADAADADDAEGLAEEFGAHVFVAVPSAFLHAGVRAGHVSAEGKEQRKGVLAGGDGVAAGGIHDDDAGGGGGVLVDVVRTDAGAADHLELFRVRERFGRDRRAAANDQPVVVADDGGQLFGFLGGFYIDRESGGGTKYLDPFFA